MANTSLGGNAICPFYLKDGNKSITCESIYGGTFINKFESEADKKNHGLFYCSVSNCKNCGFYRLNMEKYSELRVGFGKRNIDITIDINALCLILKRENATFYGLASVLGIDRSTLYRKMTKGISAISLKEYLTIISYLNFTPSDVEIVFRSETKEAGDERD